MQIVNWDQKAARSLKARTLIGFMVLILSAVIIGLYAYLEIKRGSHPYDLDGWGHLVKILIAGDVSNVCNFTMHDSYNPNRGYLLPLLFATSYCLLGFQEAIQMVNAIFHLLTCLALIVYLAPLIKSVCIPAFAALLWSFWPAYAFMHGYYYSEQIGALLTTLITIIACYCLQREKITWQWAACIGFLLGVLINVRASSLLLVVVGLLFFGIMFRKHYRSLLVGGSIFLMCYASMPIMSFKAFDAFVPFTTQGGFALHEGTYLLGDDLPANQLRIIPEFREIERQAEHLNPLEKDRYYKKLAMNNITEDPIGQLKLLTKKALRFWFNIPPYSWVPTTKSLVFGLPILLLWIVALFAVRTRPVVVMHSVVLSTWAMHALVHSEYRYSYVVFPLIIISVLVLLQNTLSTIVNKNVRK